ncbi:3-oxoacyl-[acyl-carrier-protein] synthase 2 [Arenicella chitinivorans]|uniref:3-oxoacyl-[acyl-carrier-protein] synthase 2 n=1 Tax=Arenicella chitinivorans TaxID=1329800 RepID=A0A918S1N5_9GAMM|nr:beta-ketoacyl-ACP synthase II [Arenicella chitinivorans]GHA16784.1 3-oxoacyl-[acyl-carrier-protein] synthase 2 [Arenicella chitinivorans]
MSKRRVVITGMGIISPVGLTLDENWKNITNGVSGIGRIDRFDPEGYPCQIAGQVDGFDPANYMPPKETKKMDRFIQMGMAASLDAFRDSGLEVTEANAERIGVYVGSGIGGIESIENATLTLNNRGVRRVSPFFVPSAIINMISGNLSIQLGLKGPNLSMVTACTTATHAIGDAGRLIEYGDADVMIAGGAEAAITQTAIAGFGNARALSSRDVDPAQASCPWDEARDGFVMGEGAGVLVLEEYEHAKARGARIYAELAGFGMSGDAYHMTSPSPGGEGAARCMVNAMRNAGVNPEDVDHLNAHGTSTPLGDAAETNATKTAFGDHAKHIAISSTKSMVGHLLGAAGGVEAVYTAMALHTQIAPPTINLHNPSPDCDLDYVPNTARDMNMSLALTNSFGFGGTNGTLAMKRFV